MATMTIPTTNWQGIGSQISSATTAQEALAEVGLNWTVTKKPIFNSDKQEIRGYFANVREDTNEVLGIVKSSYRVVQNTDAFDFIDTMLGTDVTLSKAGAIFNDRRIWMSTKLNKQYSVSGDPTDVYLVFSNSHDGSMAVKVFITAVRVICENMINYAMKKSLRTWTVRHTQSATKRLDDVRNLLGLTDGYIEAINAHAEELRAAKLTDDEFSRFVDMLVPESTRKIARTEELRDIIRTQFTADDVQEFAGTRLAAMNAVTWATSHREIKNNDTAAMQIMETPILVRRAEEILRKTAIFSA